MKYANDETNGVRNIFNIENCNKEIDFFAIRESTCEFHPRSLHLFIFIKTVSWNLCLNACIKKKKNNDNTGWTIPLTAINSSTPISNIFHISFFSFWSNFFFFTFCLLPTLVIYLIVIIITLIFFLPFLVYILHK